MTLTSSQFQFVKDIFGNMGLFAVIVGWEHVMLFIKYLMHSLVSPYPSSVINAIKEEEYQKNEQRNTSMREKNERRSNCYGSRPKLRSSTLHLDSTDDEYSRQSDIKLRLKKREINQSTTQIGSSEYESVTENLQDVEVANCSIRAPDSVSRNGTENLRRRVAKKNQDLKTRHQRSYTPVPNPITPKCTSRPRSTSTKLASNCETKAKLNTTSNSPFGLYFNQHDVYSPMKNRASNESDETSIGDLLSLNSGNHDGNSIEKNKKHRPSMSRSRFERESIEQERAAKERINKRISSIGESRRKKTDRYML